MLVELVVQFFVDGRPTGQPQPVTVCRSLWDREDITFDDMDFRGAGSGLDCIPARWESDDSDRYTAKITCGASAGTAYQGGSVQYFESGLPYMYWHPDDRPHAWITCREVTNGLIS